MRKNKAFTLAEVLITLSIIGVVVALTVPNIQNNYQRKALTVQLRKVISEIETAFDLQITEEGKTSLSGTRIAIDGVDDKFMNSRFKYIKKCKSDDTANCFASEEYYSIDGSDKKVFKCNGDSYILANSSAVCMNIVEEIPIATEENEDEKYIALKGLNIEIFIDINGNQPPNIGGRDMFRVFMLPDGRIYDQANVVEICTKSVDGNVACEPPKAEDTPKCGEHPFGEGCFAALMNSNWKMDY